MGSEVISTVRGRRWVDANIQVRGEIARVLPWRLLELIT